MMFAPGGPATIEHIFYWSDWTDSELILPNHSSTLGCLFWAVQQQASISSINLIDPMLSWIYPTNQVHYAVCLEQFSNIQAYLLSILLNWFWTAFTEATKFIILFALVGSATDEHIFYGSDWSDWSDFELLYQSNQVHYAAFLEVQQQVSISSIHLIDLMLR
jgi:hypothetical protein